MKKLVCLLTVLTIILNLCTFTIYADRPITVEVNGQAVEFDVAPFIEDERTLVPVRGIVEALGAQVEWNNDTRTVYITNGVDEIMLEIDSAEILKNLSIYALDVPAKIVDDRTFIPLRAVSELLDCTVEWIDSTRTVKIDSIKLPFEYSYAKETVTKETRQEGVSIVVNYTYPVISDGKDFLATDAVVRANEIAKEMAFDKFDLNDYAFNFATEWQAVMEFFSGYPNVEIDVRTTLFASEKYGTVSYRTDVDMPWTGIEIETGTYNKDSLSKLYNISHALNYAYPEIKTDVYNEFVNNFEYVRYGRELFDEYDAPEVEFVLSGDKLSVFISSILLTGVGRYNRYYSIVKQY